MRTLILPGPGDGEADVDGACPLQGGEAKEDRPAGEGRARAHRVGGAGRDAVAPRDGALFARKGDPLGGGAR